MKGVRKTKEDYLKEQTSAVFQSTNFDSLVNNVEQLRTRLLQMGCFREVYAVIDKAAGSSIFQ